MSRIKMGGQMAAVTWRKRKHRSRPKLADVPSEQVTPSVAQTVSASASAYCGADGRYHFLYRTEHKETGEFYFGKHSTANLDDGYRGSGDWIKFWRAFGPLKTIPVQFFESEEAAYAGEKAFLTLEILNDSLCQNLNEGGDGRTSEAMRRTLARPEIKETGPRAKRVETPEGLFPSLTAAANHFGISRKRGERRVKNGQWRYVGGLCSRDVLSR
jgi:hypothetical protein